VPDVPDIPDIPEEPDVPSDPDVDENGYIIFADPEVKRVLLANGVGDGVGITKEAAAEVTSIGAWFNKNVTIESFAELRHFTNVASFDGSSNYTNAQAQGAFFGCTSLRNISFPIGTAAINGGAFGDTTSLNIDVDIPTLTTLGDNAFRVSGVRRILDLGEVTTLGTYGTLSWGGEGVFYKCANLELVIIPTTVTSISDCAFYFCASLSTFVCKASVPPTLGGANTLAETPIASGTGSIYVPDASVSAYREATNWSRYASRIFPISQLPSDNPELYEEIKEYL
jgi:hypothetical protein